MPKRTIARLGCVGTRQSAAPLAGIEGRRQLGVGEDYVLGVYSDELDEQSIRMYGLFRSE